MAIVRTTITFTCLHEDSLQITDLEHALHESMEGAAVGSEISTVVEPVADADVEAALLALGSDGTFFEGLDD